MRPPEEVKRIITRQWLDKAGQDMEACGILLASEPSVNYPVCFHAQHAAEKYIKALLTWRQIEFPKTHAIELLLDLLKQTDAEMAGSLQGAAALTPYGVDVRYPGDQPEPNLENTRNAVELARRVKELISNRLMELQY